MKTWLENICMAVVVLGVAVLCLAGMLPVVTTPPPPEPAFTHWCQTHQEYQLCVKALSIRAVEIADAAARADVQPRAVRMVRFCDLSRREREHMFEIGALGDTMPSCADEQL